MQKILLLIFTSIFLISCAEESETSQSLFQAPTNTTSVDLNDNTPATVTSITSPSNGTYLYDQNLAFNITFSESVACLGNITLELDINGNSFELPLTSGNSTSTFTFSKDIDIETIDNDGITIVSINLNGDSLVDAGLNATDLDISSFTLSLSNVLVNSVRPTINSLLINTGEEFTTNTNASLNLDSTNATQMLISLSSDCSTESFEAYATTKALNLNTNLVNDYYVQLKSSAGSLTDCTAISITHDNQSPNAAVITLAGDASDIASDSSSWIASDNGPAGIDHYEFAVSTTTDYSGVVTGGEWVDVGAVTNYQIPSGLSLIGSTDYYTLIKVVDGAGNETISASASYQIIVSPEMVTNLEVSERTVDTISLGWSMPEDNGTTITDYIIEYQGGAISSWSIYSDGVSTQTSAAISGLDAETEYSFRLRAFNGTNYSGYSNTLTTETLPDLDFFQGGYKAINISGAPANQVVSLEDNNELYLEGVALVTLNRGETYAFSSSDFEVLEGSKPFYVAGKLGTGNIGGSNDQGNATWATSAWVGKEFLTILSRNAPLKVKVYAFTDSDITVKRGGVTEATQSLTADQGHTFSLSTLGSYEIISTGLIVAFSYGNQSSGYYDPKPLLPPSTDILGFPSSSAKISSLLDNNSTTFIHSNDTAGSLNLMAGILSTINPQSTSSQYQSNALRITSTTGMIANSVADSDGYCSAPFVPISMMKKKFANNVSVDYIAFASDRPVEITATFPDNSTQTINLTRTGSDPDAPYYARLSNLPAGVVFIGDDLYQAWYEPDTSTNAGDDDETIMFGWE